MSIFSFCFGDHKFDLEAIKSDILSIGISELDERVHDTTCSAYVSALLQVYCEVFEDETGSPPPFPETEEEGVGIFREGYARGWPEKAADPHYVEDGYAWWPDHLPSAVHFPRPLLRSLGRGRADMELAGARAFARAMDDMEERQGA